ncbi:hypothetical protein BGZ47_000300 [Haplosporangium gracile]|nr:hypothetical protein BGZ47_000300 [Haplosporangium gracile]
MIVKGNRRLVLAAAAALSIICCSVTPTTVIVAMAQVTPAAVQAMAWARSGSDLYIQGGYVSLNGVSQTVLSQFLALDLSTPWAVTSPSWRALANGTPSRSFYGVSLPTNQTFLTFKYVAPNFTIAAYDVTKNAWSPAQPVTTAPDILAYGLKPVVDPTSGLVYIAGSETMNAYNPSTRDWKITPIEGAMLTAKYYTSPVYNTARKTIMYVGGYDYVVNPTHFDPLVVVTEYTPATDKWSLMPTSGTPPSPSADHCMAVDDDGNTLVFYGGQTSVVTLNNAFTGAIYLLDINTGIWSTGLPPSSTPRIYAACILIGDQFVVWGGSADANNTLPSAQPIVFDTTLKKWVDSYKPPQYYIDNPPPKKPTSSSGSGNNGSSGSGGGGTGGNGNNNNGDGSGPGSSSTSSGLAPIIGGVVGGLAVILAIAGFLVYRRRQNRRLDEFKQQVSQQRMIIDAERSNKAVVQSSSDRRDDGSGGKDNISTTITYPTPPAYSPNSTNKTTTRHLDNESTFSPHLSHQAEFAVTPSSPSVYSAAVSSPNMSSSATGLSPTNSNNYYVNYDINYNNSNSNVANNNTNPRGPQSTKKSGPQATQVVSGPQEYYSPSGRAPQTLGDGGTDVDSNYHEQYSNRKRHNHPQEGVQF